MSDNEKADFGLAVMNAFGVIKNNPDIVRQIEKQTDNVLQRAELMARLAIEQLYDANIVRLNVKNFREKQDDQWDQLATLATEFKPTNRAELLAMILADATEDNEKVIVEALSYLSKETREKLWMLLPKLSE